LDKRHKPKQQEILLQQKILKKNFLYSYLFISYSTAFF